jgi:uncharacterized delta-60 repeat protein
MLKLHDRIMKRASSVFMPVWLALALSPALVGEARAQAPSNDNLTNAQAIVGTSGAVYGDNLNATAETNEPSPYVNPPHATIWFLWTSPITTTMDFSTRYSTDAGANELGTVMAVYSLKSGASLAFSNLTPVASNEYDPSAGVTSGLATSRVDFPVTIGQTFLIQVDGSTNTSNGAVDEGYVELNWSPSLVGGTFGFSASYYFAGEFDDELLEGCEPQSVDPSLHNTTGTNNIRITVTRQGGYTGRCEVTLLVTNTYYENTFYTNYTGTNYLTTYYDTNMNPTGYSNNLFTNVASRIELEDFTDRGGANITQIPIYGLFTVSQTNMSGVPQSPPTTNVFTSLSGLAIQTNFFQNFPCASQISSSPPVTNGSVVSMTTTEVFCFDRTAYSLTPTASNTVDYVAYSNVLVFNDFQMSQDVYLQVNPLGAKANGNQGPLAGPDWPDVNGSFLYYGVNPVLQLSLTNAVLDPDEDPDVTPPTISTNNSTAYLGIMSFLGNPFETLQGGPYLTATPAQFVTINLERATFRVNKPAANVYPATPPSSNTVYLYAVLAGNPGLGDTYTVNYTIDCAAASGSLVNVPTGDAFKWNGFETVANSDYAQPGHFNVTNYDFSDPVPAPGAENGHPGPCNITGIDTTTWSGNSGTITFGPFNNSGAASVAEIAIPIYNWGATEFDMDMTIQLYIPVVNSSNPNLTQKVPGFIGNINSATLTINYGGPEPGGAYDVSFNPPGQPNASYPPFNSTPGANPPPQDGGVVQAVAVQTNGQNYQAIIGGFFTSYNTTPVYGIARLLANGWLDTSFNNVSDGGVNGFVRSIVIDANGRILIGGSFTSYDGVNAVNIARLTRNGALDATFNTGIGFNRSVYALALDASGNILVGGDFTSYNTTNCNHIARLLPNGALDMTFLPDTGNGLPNFGTDQDVWAVATDTNGDILLGGEFNYVNGRNLNYLARLLPTGAVDTSFVPGPDDAVFSLAVETNNEIVIGGAFENYSLASSPGVALVNTNGTLDTSFPVGTGADGNVYSVVLQPDGEVLVGGQFRNFNTTRRLGVARLLPNGWVDTSFMDTSYNQFAGLINSYYDPSVEPIHTTYALAMQPDGNILMGGSFTNIGGGATRNAINSQINITRLIGASTPGPMTGGSGLSNCPGNITLTQSTYSTYDTSGKCYITLDRVNGSLGPAQVTLGTNTLPTGSGAASAKDFGLILPGSTPLYNTIDAHWTITPFGSYGWRQGDGYWGFNILPSTGSANALLPTTDFGDSTLNLNIFDDLAAQENLKASLSLLNITELGITSPPGTTNGPLTLGGVIVPMYPALGTPAAPLEIINNNFPVGYVGFSATNFTAVNTSNTVTLTVIRTNGNYGPISLVYYTANGTALNGSNYTGVTLAQNKTLNFSGSASDDVATFTIPILNASTLQSTKTFKVFLTNASPTGVLSATNPLGLPTMATVTIVDGNFAPGHLSFTSPSFSVLKPGLATVDVQRVGGALGELTVLCGTRLAGTNPAINGVNYLGVTNVLTWGNQDISVKTMSIQTLQDSTVDGNLNVNLSLFEATNVGATYNDSGILNPNGGPTNATLTILESDSYGTLNFAAPLSYGLPNFMIAQNAGQALITVARTSGATGTVLVNYTTVTDTNPPPACQAAVAGVNYGVTSGTLTFPPGVSSQSFTVPVYYNSAETVVTNRIVTLALTSGSTNISSQFPRYATLTILDPQLILNQAGAVDTTTQNGTGFNGYVNALTLQPDGSILAGGDFTFFNLYPFEYVARLNTAGAFDSTFLFDQAGANGNVQQVLSQTTNSLQTNNGPIVIAGSFTSVDEVTRNGIARLDVDGSVDESFNPGSGADNTIFALAETLLPTGLANLTNLAYYIGGSFANFNGVPSVGIARLNGSANSPGFQGAVDSSFNVGQGGGGQHQRLHSGPGRASG